jgi:hypothetical protein
MVKKRRGPNYTRREVLKYGAKVGVGATIWGAVGGGLGKAYDLFRQGYQAAVRETGNKLSALDEKIENSKNPVVEYTVQPVKKAEDWRGSAWRKIFGRDEKDTQEWKDKYGIKSGKEKPYEPNLPKKQSDPNKPNPLEEVQSTRRGFIRYMLGLGNQYPTESGVVAGAAYGGVKHAISGHESYKQAVTIGDLKQRVSELERKTQNSAPPSDRNKTLIILGILGMIISLIFVATTLTGFSVLSLGIKNSMKAGLAVFLASISLILLGKFI